MSEYEFSFSWVPWHLVDATLVITKTFWIWIMLTSCQWISLKIWGEGTHTWSKTIGLASNILIFRFPLCLFFLRQDQLCDTPTPHKISLWSTLLLNSSPSSEITGVPKHTQLQKFLNKVIYESQDFIILLCWGWRPVLHTCKELYCRAMPQLEGSKKSDSKKLSGLLGSILVLLRW